MDIGRLYGARNEFYNNTDEHRSLKVNLSPVIL